MEFQVEKKACLNFQFFTSVKVVHIYAVYGEKVMVQRTTHDIYAKFRKLRTLKNIN